MDCQGYSNAKDHHLLALYGVLQRNAPSHLKDAGAVLRKPVRTMRRLERIRRG